MMTDCQAEALEAFLNNFSLILFAFYLVSYKVKSTFASLNSLIKF